MTRAGRPPLDPAHQLERAHRILDAAAELILRWGYDKTTIEDVARQAGVAKGTIYLHWRTREALFTALLRRDRVAMVRELREAAPASLPELIRELVAALLRRPLTRAAVLGDSDVLGKLTRRKLEGAGGLEATEAFDRYLDELTALGALRADQSADDRFALVTALLYGFLIPQGLRPRDRRLPDARIAELVADTIGRTLGTGATPAAGVAEKIAAATRAYVDTVVELADRKLADALGAGPAYDPATARA
jgi:AcrR family transcriptional regulator